MMFLLVASALAAENPFRSEIAPAQLSEKGDGELEIVIVVPKGFHLYRDMMHVKALDSKGLVFEQAIYPTGLFMPDPANPASYREHFEETVQLKLPFSAVKMGSYEPVIELRYQGCKGGLCYKPVVDVHTVTIAPKAKPLPNPTPIPESRTWFQKFWAWLF